MTDEQKAEWDRILENLRQYLLTPQGKELLQNLERVTSPATQPTNALAELTAVESKTLDYISKNLRRGHSPSVREVAELLGLRSSRSGGKIINRLIEKRVLRRKENGRLLCQDRV